MLDAPGAGHHLVWCPEVTAALVELGHFVHAPMAERGGGFGPALDGTVRLLTTPLPEPRKPGAGRHLRRVLERHGVWHADAVLDLYGDRWVWSWPNSSGPPPTVHVVHQLYLPQSGPSLRRRAATALWAQRLGAVCRHGGHLVAHSDLAARRLRELARSDRVHRIDHPVSERRLVTVDPRRRDPDRLLFAGPVRHDKGVDVLLAALDEPTGWRAIDFPGLQDRHWGEMRQRLASTDVALVGRAGPLEESAYDEAFAAAGVAVLPYRSSLRARGAISGVLIDCLRTGTPVVVTDVLADQLPPDFDGAVIVAPDDPAALRDGLREARRRLGDLQAAAAEQGPAFVRRLPSYRSYTDQLVQLCRS